MHFLPKFFCLAALFFFGIGISTSQAQDETPEAE
jgi:hypothetical protein